MLSALEQHNYIASFFHSIILNFSSYIPIWTETETIRKLYSHICRQYIACLWSKRNLPPVEKVYETIIRCLPHDIHIALFINTWPLAEKTLEKENNHHVHGNIYFILFIIFFFLLLILCASQKISFDSTSNEAKPRASVCLYNLLSYSIRVRRSTLAFNTYLKRDSFFLCTSSVGSYIYLKLTYCNFVIQLSIKCVHIYFTPFVKFKSFHFGQVHPKSYTPIVANGEIICWLS